MEDHITNEEHNKTNSNSADGYPPKPEMVEKSENSLVRSIMSLLLYFVLFYFLFERNIAYIAAILVVIIVHEMGHLLAMKTFDYSNVKIFILPLVGALTSGKKQVVSQLQLSIIILAGPIPGVIIACILYYVNQSLQNATINMLANVFLYLNLFNLLPMFPLDGGRLLETLFFKQNHIIRLIFGILSIMALAVLFLLSSPFMIIICVFIGINLFNENRNQKIRDYLTSEHINFHQEYNSLSNKDYWLIRDCLIFSFSKKYASIKPGDYHYTILEPILMQHVNSILQTNLTYDLNVIKKIFIILLYLSAFIIPHVLFSLQL